MNVFIVEHRTPTENVVIHVASSLERALIWIADNKEEIENNKQWWAISEEIIDSDSHAVETHHYDKEGREIFELPV